VIQVIGELKALVFFQVSGTTVIVFGICRDHHAPSGPFAQINQFASLATKWPKLTLLGPDYRLLAIRAVYLRPAHVFLSVMAGSDQELARARYSACKSATL
jgi:hypothetical protein